MTHPAVTEPSPRRFAIRASKAFTAELNQAMDPFTTRTLRVTYAEDGPEPVIELRRAGGTFLDLRQVPPGVGTTIGDYQVLVETGAPVDGTVQLTCNVINNGGDQVDDRWELRGRRAAPAPWTVTIADQTASTTVHYLACDPRAELTVPTGAPGQQLRLEAADARGTATEPTVVGALPPDLRPGYAFRETTAPPHLAGLPECTAQPGVTLAVPSVATPTSVEVAVATSFGGICPENSAYLENLGAPVQATIVPPPAVPLTIAEASAPAVNRIWSLDGILTVTDSTADVTLQGTTGSGFLQSRTWPVGSPGTVAQGQFGIEWRVNLAGLRRTRRGRIAATQLRVDVGPVIPHDYDFDGDREDVFVVTGGALGDVRLAGAVQTGSTVVFTFAAPGIVPGVDGPGQGSFFFGLTSAFPARPVTATLVDASGREYPLAARAPGHA
ncbi:hypothetical protein ACI780_06830 [Geodermatophilus sp. SYSU D00814]